MELRRLGLSDIYLTPVILGGNVFGWTADSSTAFAVLDAYVEAGFNAIDTADVYSRWVPGHVGGESETVIGAWLKSRGRRDRVVVATKVGGKLPGRDKNLSAATIVTSVEGSLTRLQTDYIDLYQSHQDDPDTLLDETLEAYERLIRAGKVRAIGASHYSASRLQEALDTSRSKQLPRYNSLQPRYNLCDRSEFEDGLQSLCVERSLGAITYSSLAKGFLTGRYRCEADCERSAWYTRLLEYLTERGFRILEALESVAAVHESSMAGVALAWALAQPGVAATIVAANSVSELGELLGAAELKLEVGELQDLSAASAPDGDEVALGNPEIHSRTWSART